MENARKYIDDEKTDISEMIKGLEQKQRELAGLEKKSSIEQNKLMEEKRKSDLKELQLRQKEAELKRESLGKLQQFLKESRKNLENLVRELKEGEIDREKTLKVKDFLNELSSFAETEGNILAAEEREIREQQLKPEKRNADYEIDFAPGMEVLAGPSKQLGVIQRADKKNIRSTNARSANARSMNAEVSWIVEIGSLKISFPESELIPVLKKAAKTNIKQKSFTAWAAEYGSSNDAVYELKLRGMRFEEAMEALRNQVDAAVLCGLKTFAVVHGKGHGILRQGVHDFLRSHSAVAGFQFSRPELGGFGRTEVVLK